MLSLPPYTYLLCISTAIFIATSLSIAAVRWFHVCHATDATVDFLYPGRKMLTLAYGSNIILLPCLFNPTDEKVWHWLQDFFPLCSFFFLSLLLFAYFGGVRHWLKWQRPALLMGIPVVLLVLVELSSCFVPGLQLPPAWYHRLHLVVLGVGIIETVCCIFAVRKVLKWVKEEEDGNEEEFFSNANDFPSVFAHRMCYLVIGYIFLIWVMIAINHPVAVSVMMLLMSVLGITFLIIILPTQRVIPVQQEMEEHDMRKSGKPVSAEVADGGLDSGNELGDGLQPMSPKAVERIVSQVREYVEDGRKYLDAHLTLGDVSQHCDYSRTYVSKVVKLELGGFYNYVNALRLQHFEEYMQVHPMATQDQACSESGFSSRQAYYNVKRRLGRET